MALTEAVQDYLEKLYWFGEAQIEPTQANLARAMNVSQPSVTEMVRRLIDDGLITRDEHRHLLFTPEGQEIAHKAVSPAPAARGVPHRGVRDPVGRGARGGPQPRAPAVRIGRAPHVRDDVRRHRVPARAPDRRRTARGGRPAVARQRRLTCDAAALRERGRRPAAPVPARGARARHRVHRGVRQFDRGGAATDRAAATRSRSRCRSPAPSACGSRSAERAPRRPTCRAPALRRRCSARPPGACNTPGSHRRKR